MSKKKKPIGKSLKELLDTNEIDNLESIIATERETLTSDESLKERIDALFKEGVKYLKKGDYFEAFSDFKAILLIDKNNIKAMNNLAIAYYNLGKTEKALKLFKEILRKDPTNESARENIEIIMEEGV